MSFLDWFGPSSSEGEANQVALSLTKQGRDLVAGTVFVIAGRDRTRFADFVRGKRFTSVASGWLSVKLSPKVQIPATAKGNFPPT